MTTYTASDGDRLDRIIYAHYRTLEQSVVAVVIEANVHLAHKVSLDAGDVVNLPDVEPETTDTASRALW